MSKSPTGASGAGAGDGRVRVGRELECGHVTYALDPVSSNSKSKWYRCPEGCSGLQKAKGR